MTYTHSLDSFLIKIFKGDYSPSDPQLRFNSHDILLFIRSVITIISVNIFHLFKKIYIITNDY